MTGVQFPAGAMVEIFLRHHVQTGFGPLLASSTMDASALTKGVEQPRREADH